MHFFKLLPCVIALASPAFAAPAFAESNAAAHWATLYSEKDFHGDSFSLGAGDLNRCFALHDPLHNNVKSIETLVFQGSGIAFPQSMFDARYTLPTTVPKRLLLAMW
ncbi:hypothetical protein GGI43DRAFT_393363 [Trichoderma evansii]